MRVLLVTPFLPYPLSHGGAVRIYNLCRALTGRVEFILVAIREKNQFVDYAKLGETFSEVYLVDIDERASRDERLPEQVRGHQSAAMRALILDLARRRQPDILQIEFTHMAAFRDAAPQVPALLVEHDLTYSLYSQLARTQPSAQAQAEYLRWLRFESHWLNAYDSVWTVSEEDRLAVARDTGRSAGVFTVPNGVDTRRYAPCGGADRPEIFYVGSFRHLPNVLGFEKLRSEVMPRIWQRFPQVQLGVVAGPQHERYWAGPPDHRIDLHGFVEDLRPIYARASVVVAPLEVSAGTNIKVLEAMACGKPVVTTSAGCAGLGLVDGRDAMIRNNWDAFADAVADLIGDNGLRVRIGREARRSVELRYSWTTISEIAFESYLAIAQAPARHSMASG
jgi:glycosyltransferase involved in cell wall biosynthesis